jgi:hypothetical protein
VSWEEALSDIASRLLEIRKKYGPESIMISYGTYPKSVAIGLSIFLASLGSLNQLIANRHYCYTPHLIADLLTCGEVYTCVNEHFKVPPCVKHCMGGALKLELKLRSKLPLRS